MSAPDFKAAYRTVRQEHFPDSLEIRFGEGPAAQALRYLNRGSAT